MRIFVDTSAWLALEDQSDQFHSQAVKTSDFLKQKHTLWITSEYVFLETVTLIRFRVSHQAATLFGEALLKSRLVEIVEIDELLRQKSWQLFKQYSDKEFSFVDCSSFALMQDRHLTQAFTFDHHFDQMGFERFVF